MEVRWPIHRWEIPVNTVLNAGRTDVLRMNLPFLISWGEEQEDVLGAWNQLVADAKKEDEKAVHLIHETAGYLGRLISVLITMMDPEYIYIGGEITDIYEELFANMNQIVQERCFLYGNRRVKLVKDGHSELTIHSGINESIYAQWKP